MTDAEKKWEEFDVKFETVTFAPFASFRSREAYKQALREAIMKRIEEKNKKQRRNQQMDTYYGI